MSCAGGMPVDRRGSCDLSLNFSMAANLKRRRIFGQVERVPHQRCQPCSGRPLWWSSLALLPWLQELRTERELVLRNTLLALKIGRESHG